jgi:Fur family ferric uptake transcriptional regulator
MSIDMSEQLLKKHHLRVTDSRKQVLDIFLNKKFAISHSFLEQELKHSHDRVTIYRNLYSFLENGIIHKVLDEGGSSKYALCSSCNDHKHTHDHVHFKCEKCGETKCLNELPIPVIKLPNGFIAKEIGILIQGICDKCNL